MSSNDRIASGSDIRAIHLFLSRNEIGRSEVAQGGEGHEGSCAGVLNLVGLHRRECLLTG